METSTKRGGSVTRPEPGRPSPTTPAARFGEWLANANGLTQLLTSIVGLLTALGLVGATAAAVVSTNAKASAESSVDTKQATIDDQNRQITALRSQVNDLQGQLASATAASAQSSSRSTSSPAGGSTPATSPPVYRHGLLSFNSSSHDTDLDAPDTDPQWGRNKVGDYGSGYPDLAASGGGLALFISTVQWVPVSSSDANYVGCSSNTNYGDTPRAFNTFKRGQAVCLKTSDDRYALLRVTSATANSVQMMATVWKKEGDL